MLCTYKYFYFLMQQACNESVTAVQGGYVGNAHFEELVITTHAGNKSVKRKALNLLFWKYK